MSHTNEPKPPTLMEALERWTAAAQKVQAAANELSEAGAAVQAILAVMVASAKGEEQP